MAVRIKSITFGWADPCRLARFWSQLAGFSEDTGNGNVPGGPAVLLLWPDGPLALLFIAVPEPGGARNRVHLDLVPFTSRRGGRWASSCASVPGWPAASAGQTAADGWFSAIWRAASSVSGAAPAIERLAAFPGRPASTGRAADD